MTLRNNLFKKYWRSAQSQAPAPTASDIPLPYYEVGAIWVNNGNLLDTGLMTDPTDEWIIVTGKTNLNQSGHVCGGSYSKTDSNAGIYSGGGNNGHRLSIAFGNISGSGELEILDEDLGIAHEIRVKHSTGEVWVDGVFKGQKQVTNTIPHPTPLTMFGQPRTTTGTSSSYGSGYIKSFKIIRNGVLIRDFIAVCTPPPSVTYGFIDTAAVRNGTGQVFYPYGTNELNDFDVQFTVEVSADDLTYKFISTMEFSSPIKTGTTVDWGDGNVENIENSRYFQHTYASPGEYQIHAKMNYADGVFTLTCDSDDDNALKVKSIESVSGQIITKNFLRFARNVNFDISAIKNLRFVPEYGFRSCNVLTLSALPRNLVAIGVGGFEYCGNITITALPPHLEYIGNYAFSNCQKLAITSIPKSVKYIGNSAFMDCTNLPLRELRAQVTEICNNAFSGCSALALSELPATVTSIGSLAFYNCRKLALSKLPDAVTTIGTKAFSQCSELSLSELPPNLVGTIGVEAFWICVKITVNSIPEGVVTIDQRAFAHCYSITSMEFPSTLETLAAGCFTNCSGLRTVVFNSTPTSIASSSFNNCTNLTDIYVPWVEGDVANAPWGASNATIHYNSQA